MSLRELPETFQVAFSFAGEQRDLVRAVAEAVEKVVGPPNVFFDEWYEYYIAGDDADLRLQDIYGKKCILAVVCVSARYGDKPWTQAEYRAIRARQMRLSGPSATQREQLGILPIRVGDGDVKGIYENTIAPDIREKTVAQAAELIIQRLQTIDPSLLYWPEESTEVRWPMANHTEVRGAFQQLLTRAAPWRVLLVRGPSESGKSHITKQMLSYALRIRKLPCGRFDFKGTIDTDVELRSFVQNLDVTLPSMEQKTNERLAVVLDALQRRAQPALLVFDTYEAAGVAAQDWIEKQLLQSLVRAPWLRVVISGQVVPGRSGAIWEADASPLFKLKPPPPADWFEYGKQYHPELTLEDVEKICKLASDKASLLQQLLGPGA